MSVVVLGMHRSGTSAVTRVINLLGPSVGDLADLLPPNAENPKGFWESASLTAFNDELLHFLGGSWSGPPRLDDGWEFDVRLDPYRERGFALFRSIHGDGAFVWKDPRNCLTLPFWLSVLNIRPAVVLVLRNPLEVWRSLVKRHGSSKIIALALWERYTRAALRSAKGLATLVTRYEDLLEDPLRWSERTRAFLIASSVSCENGIDGEELRGFLDETLRHSRFTSADVESDPDLSPAQRQLFECAEVLVGEHASLTPPALGPESPWTEALLGERRRGDIYERRRHLEYRAADEERQRLDRVIAAGEEERQRLRDALARVEGERQHLRDALAAAEPGLRRAEEERSELERRLLELRAERDRDRKIACERLAGSEEALRKTSIHLELSQNEVESLSEEVLRLGRAIAVLTGERDERSLEIARLEDEVSCLHVEVARRQELIDAFRQTRFWRLRVRLRNLVRVGP